jgi:tryptophan synthase beta chain
MMVCGMSDSNIKLGGTAGGFSCPFRWDEGFFIGSTINRSKKGVRNMTEKIPHKIYLTEDEMPKQWYNVKADMKEQHDPFLNPGTCSRSQRRSASVFLRRIGGSGVGLHKSFYRYSGRIAGLLQILSSFPARACVQSGKTAGYTAKIYYKFEGTNTSGSHKLNSAAAQAYYAKKQGSKD